MAAKRHKNARENAGADLGSCSSSKHRPESVHCFPSSVFRPLVSAFSLIEVIVAVAIFAGAVTVVLALLPGLTQRGVETADRLVAQQLPAALQAELRRLSSAGFDALAAQVPLMGMPPENGLAFVATRNGAHLHARDYRPPAGGRIADDEQYFLIECWRFGDGPLAFDPAQSALALAVRVSWPHRQPGSTAPTPPESRHEFMFTVGVNR